jgi:outer membrane protein assembly factor BamB
MHKGVLLQRTWPKWDHKTEFPTWVSPLVTNGLVFTGHVTAIGNEQTGTTYQVSGFGGPTSTPLLPSGNLMALDADTGETLWELNVGSAIGIGGPSIGNGMLLVPTGHIQTPSPGGYIVAFGLPSK